MEKAHLKKSVIFVPGIFTWNGIATVWEEELKKVYADHEVIIVKQWYTYWSISKMRDIVATVQKLIEQKQEVVLIGFSLGGIIVTAAACMTQGKVQNVTTICTPHHVNYGGMKKRKALLQYEEGLAVCDKVRSVTIGGFLDVLVPFWLSHSETSVRKNIFADHVIFFLFRRNIHRILAITKKEL